MLYNKSKGGSLDKTNRLILGVLDGWGIGPVWGGNAIANARTPAFSRLWHGFPHSQLKASGRAVGLTAGEAGNSEVGHLTMGAGRTISQDDTRISQAIQDKSFFSNPVLLSALKYCRAKRQPLHLLGLLSQEKVHADIHHLYGLLDLIKLNNFFQPVFLHLITDGRDSPPQSALELLEKLMIKIKHKGVGQLASISGRFYAMDRDNHGDRTRACFQMLTQGGKQRASSARQAISTSYHQGLTDEYIYPTNLTGPDDSPQGLIKPRQVVIFFNFRQDRVKQLTQLLVQKVPQVQLISFVPYEMQEVTGVKTCFSMPEIKNHLTEVVSQRGLRQIHMAESEKFAHISYFFNGGVSQPYPQEERVLIKSQSVYNWAQYPQMQAAVVTNTVIKSIRQGFDFILFNLANSDVIGHTGDMEAAIAAIEEIDKQLIRLVEAIKKTGYQLIITADHGNVEEMVNRSTGEPRTSHTANPVPFILVNSQYERVSPSGGLSQVAPTILKIFGLAQPPEMTGESLV